MDCSRMFVAAESMLSIATQAHLHGLAIPNAACLKLVAKVRRSASIGKHPRGAHAANATVAARNIDLALVGPGFPA